MAKGAVLLISELLFSSTLVLKCPVVILKTGEYLCLDTHIRYGIIFKKKY